MLYLKSTARSEKGTRNGLPTMYRWWISLIRLAYLPASLCALIILLASCTFKTVYNNFDYLIPKYIEGMVPLDEFLEDEIDNHVSLFMQWHRETQMKPYAEWMNRVRENAGPNITRNQVEERLTEAEEFWVVMSGRLNESVARVLPKMNEEQRTKLFTSIQEKNDDLREEYIDIPVDERSNYYAEKLVDNYEFWLDELTDEQVNFVKEAAAQQVDTAELRLQRRLQWQKEVQSILDEDLSKEEQSKKLLLFLQGFQTVDTSKFRKKAQFNREVIIGLTVKVSRSMTRAQLKHFDTKIN